MLRTTIMAIACLLPLLSSSQIISLFEFDTPSVMTATIGPDAVSISGSCISDVPGTGGTNGLNAGLPKLDIDMRVPGSPTFDIPGIDVSLDFQREENVGHFWRRGNSLLFGGASNLYVSYRVEDGMGGYNTVNSGNVYAIPNDNTYRNYRFVYMPSTGMGLLMVNSVVVWSNDGPDFRNLYWTGAGDVHIGDQMDGNGNNRTFIDNVQVGEVWDSPLPIELKEFNALVTIDNTVSLEWETISEKDNDYFTIERSQDGRNWEKVGTVDGAGTTSELQTYELIDENPYLGISYYRLKQTDYNGESIYYKEQPVDITQSVEVLIFPNPARVNAAFTVGLEDGTNAELQIRDMAGKLIQAETRHVQGGIEVTTSDWQPGVYLITIVSNPQSAQGRVIIQ